MNHDVSMTFPSTGSLTCIDTVLILPPFIDLHACCASLKHFRIWLCLSVTDYSDWDFLLFLLEGTRSRRMINTYCLLTEMHSQIRRKRQASVQGGTDLPGSLTELAHSHLSLSGRAEHCPCLWPGTLSLRVSSSCQTHVLNCQDAGAAISGKWKLLEMVKSLMPFIWGVTESGPQHPQQGFQQWRCYWALQLQGGDSSCLHSPSK